MLVKDLNQGEKASYSLEGNLLTIKVNQQEINIDLASEQEDESKTIDICLDHQGKLVQGVVNWYVANISIPASTYTLVDTEEVDENEHPQYNKVKNQLNLQEVKLDLWALPNFIKEKEMEGEILNDRAI